MAVAVALAGCGPGPEPEPGDGRGSAAVIREATPPPPLSTGESPAPAGVGAALRADLAARRGVDPRAIASVAFAEQTWPNGCLGLQQAGEVCSQAMVPGWLATLTTADGRQFRYRGTGERFVPEP
ncbi:MAG: hypothetical protein IPF51_08815 [Dehalococcoidia bacterium]|uniref:hypothetical protein n=1 Tax=Candidatus Amarobacter glycogenicus TaxID=3140699 RepID=UPI00313768F0|nr:hypothetical protein [Dehalococcoidia bacterium]